MDCNTKGIYLYFLFSNPQILGLCFLKSTFMLHQLFLVSAYGNFFLFGDPTENVSMFIMNEVSVLKVMEDLENCVD